MNNTQRGFQIPTRSVYPSANPRRANLDSHLFVLCLRGHSENVPARLLATQAHLSLRVRARQLRQPSPSKLHMPMALRITVASKLLLVVAPTSKCQDKRGMAKPTFPSCPQDRRFEVKRAPWAWNADHALLMRRSYSSGPPVTSVSPRTTTSVFLSSTLPAAEICSGRSAVHRYNVVFSEPEPALLYRRMKIP